MKNLSTIYINGEFVKVPTATLEVFTPGVFAAQGVFETMLAIGEEVFDGRSHLMRLSRAFKGAKISLSIIQKVVKLNGFAVSRVRVLAWKHKEHKHVIVMALKYVLPTQETYKACLIKTSRPANARLANIKSLDYKIFADAYTHARLKGFDEALLINKKGYVFEASRGNVFWVKNNKIFTPPLSSGCLNGITRAKVIKLAHQLKIPFQEKNCLVTELKVADSIFITNSLIGLKSLKIQS